VRSEVKIEDAELSETKENGAEDLRDGQVQQGTVRGTVDMKMDESEIHSDNNRNL